MYWQVKLLGFVLLLGLSASMAAQSLSAGQASSAAQPRFAQTSPAQTPVVEHAARYSYYSGSPLEPSCIAGTNFYFLGTVSSPDTVQQHSDEVVIPAERVQERPGDRIQPMPRIGEE